jgi:hypothetical protein
MQRSGSSTIGGLSGEYRKARISANRQSFLVPPTGFGTAGRRSARGHPTEIDPLLTLATGGFEAPARESNVNSPVRVCTTRCLSRSDSNAEDRVPLKSSCRKSAWNIEGTG